jgi:hypothetical protein
MMSSSTGSCGAACGDETRKRSVQIKQGNANSIYDTDYVAFGTGTGVGVGRGFRNQRHVDLSRLCLTELIGDGAGDT